jgi:hypothetical protein
LTKIIKCEGVIVSLCLIREQKLCLSSLGEFGREWLLYKC